MQSPTSRMIIDILHVCSSRCKVQELEHKLYGRLHIELQVNYIQQLSVQVGKAERNTVEGSLQVIYASGCWDIGKHVQNDRLGSTAQGTVYAMVDLQMLQLFLIVSSLSLRILIPLHSMLRIPLPPSIYRSQLLSTHV